MTFASARRRRDLGAGQPDRVVTVKRYSLSRNQYGETVTTLDWTREAWVQVVGAGIDLTGDHPAQPVDYGRRYDPDYLYQSGKRFTITDPNGADTSERIVTSFDVLGRREWIVLGTG